MLKLTQLWFRKLPLIYKVLLGAWVLFMAWLCLYPFEFDHNKKVIWEHSDKIAHVIMHSVLIVFALLSYNGLKVSRILIFYTVLGCLFYGIVLEVFQWILPTNRSFEWLDILANFSGTIFGLTCYFLAKHKLKNRVDVNF